MNPVPTADIPDSLRTAVDLKDALDNADMYLTPIGTCRSKVTEWRQQYEQHEQDLELDEELPGPGEEIEILVMAELRKLQSNYARTVAFGTMYDPPFRLSIARAGCEYDGPMSALAGEGGTESTEPDIGERLRQWYEAGTVSGYGDVKTQETKIDPAVRDAREIPASEFHVSPDLIARVQDIWAKSFFPTHVRAEPYKIHLYGPGGKFKAHRDTPETGLVGTFLVGLGDTSKTSDRGWNGGALGVKSNGKWTRHTAHLGSWVAFYPDVDYCVREIASGYRAVIALKIFREHLDIPEIPADVTLRNKITDVLAVLHKPYGILLQHHYCAGTAELNGLDAALYAAAGETGGDVKLLPVLIRWTATRYPSYDYDHYDDSSECSADVFPMTDKHVEAVLAQIMTGEDDEEEETEDVTSKPKLFIDLKGTNAEWNNYRSTESIPFYSPGFCGTSIVWKEDVQEGAERTGNESRAHREDSVYLSYAVVVLPKRGTKRPAETSEVTE
ncbi:hypothetical protein MVEN_00586900 [Mycena venus]|uniref:Fe2OG dioxygenase domain-containing protein n=1 Tax=Mycena venus TaxID=2733690 RepID=A0A8H7D7L8_9AGAR|nr:hypothetical protein MVEN_00586900 [Mycena venus]